MRKHPLIIVFALSVFSASLFAQQCDNPEDKLDIDTSSITKCAVQDWQDSNGSKSSGRHKQITIEISSRRYRSIRKIRKATSSIGASERSLAAVNSSGIVNSNIDVNNTTAVEAVFSPDLIEEFPLFKNCKGNSNEKCFMKEMIQHIKKNYYYPKEARKAGVAGRVIVQFIIDKNGNINSSQIKARGPRGGESLVTEAKRIIAELPNFKPAKQNGIPVNVKYTFPIAFKLPNDAKSEKEVIITDAISFADVEEIPRFTSCKSVDSNKEVECFNHQMMKHIQQNFAYPKYAIENNIEGKVWVNFIIDKKGKVTNIKMRDEAKILQSEAERLIAKLPKFLPAKQNGKPVNVRYVLPITFKLND